MRFAGVLLFAALLFAACEHNDEGGLGPPAPGQLATLTVTPNPATVPTNGTQQFIAVGRDATGAVVVLPAGLAWSVVAGGGAINSSSGLFTAGTVVGPFTNTVKATSGPYLSGFATVIVTAPGPVGPALGTAATYGILAGSTVTCAGAPGTINADVGVSPGSTTTGFPPCTITGVTHLADAVAATAQADLTTAYNDLVARPCGTTIVADLGGTTITPGVYCGLSSVGVTGTVTLDGQGDANALFVIKAASTLTTAGTVSLINGTQAKNVWWQVGSSATLGNGTVFRGNIIALTTITLNNTVTMTGRALARNGAVSLGTSDTITLP
jgi:hypothetical protein